MKSICAVEGVRAAGVKEGKFGLALIEAQGTAAAVFTRNQVVAEPVKLMRELMPAGFLDGIIVNSGNANVYTGDAGVAAALRMGEIAAAAFGTTPDRVGVASTGVIGRFPDVSLIERQCTAIAPQLRCDASAEDDAAAAIMTTDLSPKHALVRGDGFAVAGIAKGSGMIAPNMGTMLAFLYTDAALSAADLQAALTVAVDRSFNRVVVDGDTSTNDCVFVTATGRKGRPDPEAFQAALEEVCVSLARQIAADGEGATKLLVVRVSGARTEEEAALVARTVAGSSLVKTAVYGRDPNWGRIVAAAGRAGVSFDPGTMTVSLRSGDREVVFARRGAVLADAAALAEAQELMAGDTVTFAIDLGEGGATATAWGCDLTETYVEINGKYTT
ncbi:MAG: bifunctional ornithine acetyltransferase/N-acetylglutamate synthase [Methanomicrobiaceae archaeon]|nr:bifunctional ornithine acetyltransferase/N-acetylglutamate synthase [Methanomicrobiaceae archaeon]